MNKAIILLIGLIFVPTIVLAKWTLGGEIIRVYSHDGYHVISTTITNNPCGDAGKFWWPTTDSDAKDMLAMALTALTTQKSITVAFNETTLDCKWEGQLATHMSVNR